MTVTLGDCVDVMAAMPAASVDAIVTDPPYSLSFMGREWDSHVSPAAFQTWCATWACEALRVLKPGGHVLAFGGTRTYHRLACAIEDAGFEVRDCIAWLYGSGFPKSLDVAKAIDKAAGAERDVVGDKLDRPGYHLSGSDGGVAFGEGVASHTPETRARAAAITAPAAAAAERWDGWGTALKPAFEPVVVARKPITGTVAGNVLTHGVGALNIDGCRISFADADDEAESKDKNRHADFGFGARENHVYGADDRARGEHGNYDAPGRWPANVTLDPEAAAMLDAQTGELARGNHPAVRGPRGIFGSDWPAAGTAGDAEPTDAGGASRFFYCAKTSSAERNAGLDGFEERESQKWNEGGIKARRAAAGLGLARNNHPTVKPVALMRWLVRLVTPPGGLVLDPFLGSGTTGIAATLEGFRFAGVERDPDYLRIAEARIAFWCEHGEEALDLVADRERTELRRREIADSGQLDLLADA